jgi:hypothetical protein
VPGAGGERRSLPGSVAVHAARKSRSMVTGSPFTLLAVARGGSVVATRSR